MKNDAGGDGLNYGIYTAETTEMSELVFPTCIFIRRNLQTNQKKTMTDIRTWVHLQTPAVRETRTCCEQAKKTE